MEEDDWTAGRPVLAYERCRRCGATWYFRRGFCPRCGDGAPERLVASGRGRAYAVTEVARAPTAELRARAPYGIALVDAAEGFRLMAHAAPGIRPGDPVAVRFIPWGAGIIPLCEREEDT